MKLRKPDFFDCYLVFLFIQSTISLYLCSISFKTNNLFIEILFNPVLSLALFNILIIIYVIQDYSNCYNLGFDRAKK